jgi:hypothetical protein
MVLAAVGMSSGTLAIAAPSSSPDPLLAYYPRSALDRGVSGLVSLSCGRTEHGGFTDCHITRESPSGEGFGEAALALAAKAVECPTMTAKPTEKQDQGIVFAFSAKPLFITPDVLRPDWPITTGRWLRRPTGDDMAFNYPRGAAMNHVSGHATMVCSTKKTGDMNRCLVLDETPVGYGFGAATLAVSREFRVAPNANCSGPMVESVVVIPVGWIMSQ